MFNNKMLGLMLIACHIAQIFAVTECMFGDLVCWTNLANSDLVPKLSNGISELGIENLENMHLKDVDINEKINLKVTNITVLGFKNAFVEEIRKYLELKLFRIVIQLNLTVVGDYSVKGSFFTLPVSGRGKMTVLLHNVRFEMLTPYDIIKRENGKIKVILQSLLKSFHSYGGIDFNFEDNDKNNRDVGEKLNVVLNDNWRVFEGYGAGAWSEITQKIFNGVKLILATFEMKMLNH